MNKNKKIITVVIKNKRLPVKKKLHRNRKIEKEHPPPPPEPEQPPNELLSTDINSRFTIS